MSSRKIFSAQEGDLKMELYGKESGDLEIHIDGAWGLTYAGGACKINLYTIAPTTEDNYERREVVARITMLPQVLFALKSYLDRQCKRLLEMGIVLSPEELPKELAEKFASEVAEKIRTPEVREALPSSKKPEKK